MESDWHPHRRERRGFPTVSSAFADDHFDGFLLLTDTIAILHPSVHSSSTLCVELPTGWHALPAHHDIFRTNIQIAIGFSDSISIHIHISDRSARCTVEQPLSPWLHAVHTSIAVAGKTFPNLDPISLGLIPTSEPPFDPVAPTSRRH